LYYTELTQVLDCDLRAAADIATHLKKRKFLVLTPGSESRTFAKSGKPKYTAVTDDHKHAEMMAAYFDPAFNIAHLVSIC
jgi:hypothetical protein